MKPGAHTFNPLEMLLVRKAILAKKEIVYIDGIGYSLCYQNDGTIFYQRVGRYVPCGYLTTKYVNESVGRYED